MRRPVRGFSSFKKDLIDLIEGEFPQDPENQVYYDMLANIDRLRQEKFDIAELKLLNTAFKELRHALQVFKSYRHVPKAAVFGSARTIKGNASFRLASAFGRKLARKGWMIITGGASGIMEAAMVGAGADNSFGLNILLPFEQEANPVIRGNPKLMFLKESEATVLFPGGFGTFDEGFESFTLVQTGKAKPRPLVLIDPPGDSFWRSTLKLLKRNMEGPGLLSPGDLSLMRHFQDPDQAVEEITRFYGNYHSSRFLRDRYLVRFKKPISDAALEKLAYEFKDIVSKGSFERYTDIEDDDVKDSALQRIVFSFDRSSYNRLRQLIDRLNSL